MGAMYWSKSVVRLTMLAGNLAIAAWASPEARASPAAARGAEESAVREESPCTQALPSEIAVPAGNDLELELSATGVQIYTCTATPGGAAWVFTAPEATLYDRRGVLAGTHYAGPTWKSIDGSTVVAAKSSGVTLDATAIPWLLLGAVSHDGPGEMRKVTNVQRVSTVGGTAPTTGCDAASVGSVKRVPYTAMYCFYDKE